MLYLFTLSAFLLGELEVVASLSGKLSRFIAEVHGSCLQETSHLLLFRTRVAVQEQTAAGFGGVVSSRKLARALMH